MNQRRAAETGFALLAAGFGLTVLGGALQHDTGWGVAGPGAGYFPLRIGGLLAGVGIVLAIRKARAGPEGVVLDRFALRRVVGLFIPTALFGIAMPYLGTYLPMALYLLWMARVVGGQGWLPSIALALLAPPAFYFLFEYWLMVPLAKGPIEEALGIW